MKNLKNLLERFSNSLNKDSIIRETISEVVFTKARVRLLEGATTFKDGVLTITTTQTAKSELRLKEEVIKRSLIERGVKVSRISYR